MGLQKSGNQKVRKLGKLGGENASYYITLPIDLIRKYGWKDGQKLVVKETGDGKLQVSDFEE